jgi:ribose-phosphate pyrophosphokinase
MPPQQESIKIFGGTASKSLAEQIAKASGERLGEVVLNRFSDGEFQPSFEETVRGDEVYIVQSTFPPTDNLFELLLMIDAAKRASAKRIVAVMPYFGFGRQDRKDKPRVSIGAKLVANMLTTAGVDRIMTMDLHADQIQGFFEVPVDHLFASSIFVPYIQSLNLPDLLMVAPDTGGTKRASAYAKHLGVDIAICYKQRQVANKIEKMTVIGDVRGRDVMLVDDMVDTAGTLAKAADMMMEQGANSVRAVCTHPVLSGEACTRVEDSALTSLIVTDSIPISAEKFAQTTKIQQLSTAPLFGNVIQRVRAHESISSHFIIA